MVARSAPDPADTGHTAPVLFVQFGDFRETVERFAGGGTETYHSQRVSVEAVERWQRTVAPMVVLCLNTASRYDVQLASGVRAIGSGPIERFSDRLFAGLMDEFADHRVVLRTPIVHVLRWLARTRAPTLATLADSFNATGLRARLREWQQLRLLRRPHIEWIGNHGRGATRQLRERGIDPARLLAWDWPAASRPGDNPAKRLFPAETRHLVYAGLIAEGKGVFDLVEALALPGQAGPRLRLSIAGAGEGERLHQLVAARGLAAQVDLLGLVPHDRILSLMRDADLAVVPSRPSYDEGLPMVIYEALAARTPLVLSDHPMFKANLGDTAAARYFPAGNAQALQDTIVGTLSDPDGYAAMSDAGASTWESLQIPVIWMELVDRWLGGSTEDLAWLDRHSVAQDPALDGFSADTV